jgi:hypothetical protein
MSAQFEHLGAQWEAVSSGVSTGAGFFGDASPPLTSHGVIFRSPWGEFRGVISKSDVEDASVEELRGALDRELERRVLGAIQQSRYTWRPAEAISKDTNIPLEHVLHILETTSSAEVISGPRNKDGLLLYTTKDHFVQTGGDVMKRYAETDESS